MSGEKLKCGNINFSDLQAGLLPKSFQNKVHICLFDEEKNFTFRMKLTNEEEFNRFLEEWSNEGHLTWRVHKSDPNNMCAGKKNVFWRQYRCQSSNSRIDKTTKNPSKKHTDCKAAFTVTIKKINKRSRTQDKHLPEYPTIIKGCIDHNHGIFCADNLKYKDVSKNIQLKFTKLFQDGYSPISALGKHKFDLQAKYKENYFIAAADRSLCPDLQWCYKLCNSIKRKDYVVQENFEQQLSSRFDTVEHIIVEIVEDEIPQNSYNSLNDTSSTNNPDLVKNVNRLAPSVSSSEMPVTIPLEIEEKDHAKLKSEVSREFKSFTDCIVQKLETEPEFITAVNTFNNSFKRCKTDTALLHALRTFGKAVGKKRSKEIQLTSRARRKRPLGGSNRLGSGRPYKKIRMEHSYFKKKQDCSKSSAFNW